MGAAPFPAWDDAHLARVPHEAHRCRIAWADAEGVEGALLASAVHGSLRHASRHHRVLKAAAAMTRPTALFPRSIPARSEQLVEFLANLVSVPWDIEIGGNAVGIVLRSADHAADHVGTSRDRDAKPLWKRAHVHGGVLMLGDDPTGELHGAH